MNNGHTTRNKYLKDPVYKYLNNLRSTVKNMQDSSIDKSISVFVNRSLLILYKKDDLTNKQSKRDAMHFLLLDAPLLMIDSIMGRDLEIETIDEIFNVDSKIEDIEEVDYFKDEPTDIVYTYIENPFYKVYNYDYIKTSRVRNKIYSNEYILNVCPSSFYSSMPINSVNHKEYNIVDFIKNTLNIPHINNFFKSKNIDKDVFLTKSLEHINDYIENEYGIVNFRIYLKGN